MAARKGPPYEPRETDVPANRLGCRSYKARSHWVVEDVPDYVRHIVSIAQDTFEISRLPKATLDPYPRRICAALFRGRDEIAQVRCKRRSARNNVQMVGHEAVRKKFEVVRHRALRELQQYIGNEARFDEAATPAERAQRFAGRPFTGRLRGESDFRSRWGRLA
jgi:hypothetical protein